MLDTGALITAIDRALNTISGLANRTVLDFIPPGWPTSGNRYPVCRYSAVANPAIQYVGGRQDNPVYQFDVFSTTVTEAGSLQKSIATKFDRVLTGGIAVGQVLDASKIVTERVAGTTQVPSNTIYHAIVLVMFREGR